jgi:hypothetical protein
MSEGVNDQHIEPVESLHAFLGYRVGVGAISDVSEAKPEDLKARAVE